MSEASSTGRPDRSDIEALLMASAVGRANHLGRRFKPDAEKLLAECIAQAATEMVRPTNFGQRSGIWTERDLSARVSEGQRAGEALVDRMAMEASNIADYASDTLGETTFLAAWGFFCPCWPFC